MEKKMPTETKKLLPIGTESAIFENDDDFTEDPPLSPTPPKRKKHTNEEGEEWSESQQKKDIIAAFLDPNSGIHTLSIPAIFEEYAADHGWMKLNATAKIRTIKKQYEGKKGPFSEKEVNKIEPFKTRTTKSKAYPLLLKVHMNSEQSEAAPASKLLPEKKKPPRKKLTATKSEKPRKATNISWKRNYEIVETVCNVLDALVTKDSGNNERLGWYQLVGNETHACPYLHLKKKISLWKVLSFVVGNDDKIAKSVRQFLRNTKYLDKEKMPYWKVKLLDDLKLDIQK